MIIKKLKNRANGKPMSWQINDLVDYIRSPQNRNPAEKVLHATGWNFLTGTHSAQKSEMICLASEATHTNNPVSHWVMSSREGEVPSRQQTDEVVSIFLEQMGLQGHQVIYALHGDTKSVHLHICHLFRSVLSMLPNVSLADKKKSQIYSFATSPISYG